MFTPDPYLDVELEIFVHLVDVGEDVGHDSGDNALHMLVAQHSLHGMRLSGRRLTVGKDGSIVTAQHICDYITFH